MELSAHAELDYAWNQVCTDLRQTVGDSQFETWLSPVKAVSWDGTTLLLSAPAATGTWIAERFGPMLTRRAEAALAEPVQLRFTTTEAPPGAQGTSSGGSRTRRASSSASPLAAHAQDADLPGEPLLSLNPRLSFDQFVIGAGNRLAHAAALAVAENPGQTYNPLFLHAPPGHGKTHLLHAIGNYVLAFGSGATVRYTTVETFTNNFIRALATHTLERFKAAHRSVDLLLIDDVQFLASKARTEEEFFHTFNALHENGRQLVLTCDRLPRELLAIEDRLRERFASGLVARIEPPDVATRLTILRKRAALDRIPTDDAVLRLIAERVTENVRALEGALIRTVAHSSLTGRTLDVALAGAVLDESQPHLGPAQLTVADIQSVVCEHFALDLAELLSSGRAARLSGPRQLAMFLARELTKDSLPAIGEAFGGRDHTTVLYALRRVSERLRGDPETATLLATLRGELTT